MTLTVTRRGVLVVAAGVGAFSGAQRWVPAGIAGNPDSVAQAQEATPVAAEGEMVGEAEMPRWIFRVLVLQDPYTGVLTRPAEPEPGVRYIGAEVRIENQSDQPLAFAASAVRLRDDQGVEYTSDSDVSGEEPKLTGQNLPDGERARGWVWFSVPEDAVITEMRFLAPSSQLRVQLPS
jgi:hypothetical protein